jgi:hypothetical protein
MTQNFPYQTACAPSGALSILNLILSELPTAPLSISGASGSAIVTVRSPLAVSDPLLPLQITVCNRFNSNTPPF